MRKQFLSAGRRLCEMLCMSRTAIGAVGEEPYRQAGTNSDVERTKEIRDGNNIHHN